MTIVEAPNAQVNVVQSEIDDEFMKKVLMPYRRQCCYLKKSYFQQRDEEGVQGLIMNGEFAIPESCYIDDTGHFNSVEQNICYNQIIYLFLAHCISHKLIPELSDYEMETFFEKQLSHILIASISSNFQSIINAKHFYGTVGITSLKKTRKCTFTKTYCYFYDDEKGKSKGEVTLAILKP